MVTLLASNPTVKTGDNSFNKYYDKTTVSDVTTAQKSPKEQKIFDFFKTVHNDYEDYVCVFMGMKDGGYSTLA